MAGVPVTVSYTNRKPAFAISSTSNDQKQLEQRAAAHSAPQQVARRCHIIVASLADQQNKLIAAHLQVSRPTVNLWRKRVGELGIAQV
jgi:FixJ family two-component response regulator